MLLTLYTRILYWMQYLGAPFSQHRGTRRMTVIDQLTQRQQQVYEFIHDKIVNRGYGPTVREIGEHFDISSPNGVMCHLKALEKKGLIRPQPQQVAGHRVDAGSHRRRTGVAVGGLCGGRCHAIGV